jgi:hypothetical protein
MELELTFLHSEDRRDDGHLNQCRRYILQIAWLVLGYSLNLLLSIRHPIYTLTTVSIPTFTPIIINLPSYATFNCMPTVIVVVVVE